MSPFVEVRVWSLEEDVLNIDASVTSSTVVVVRVVVVAVLAVVVGRRSHDHYCDFHHCYHP